jgi:hypothetical protein
MQSGLVHWLEANDELAGGTPHWAHADLILPADEPKYAAMDRDLGDIAPPICKARFWPFRTGGIGSDGEDLLAEKIQNEDQRAEPDREAPE